MSISGGGKHMSGSGSKEPPTQIRFESIRRLKKRKKTNGRT